MIIAGVEIPKLSRSDADRRLQHLGRVALAGGILIPLLGLLPELLDLTPDLNDGAFHLGVACNTGPIRSTSGCRPG